MSTDYTDFRPLDEDSLFDVFLSEEGDELLILFKEWRERKLLNGDLIYDEGKDRYYFL